MSGVGDCAVTAPRLLMGENGGARAGLIKICGLREPAHAAAAARAGADLLGFIFAPARRRVTPETAAACVAAAREAAASRRVLAVGVFVAATAEEMNAAADAADLDLLQVHGERDHDLLPLLRRPVLKVLRPQPGTDAGQVETLAASYKAAMCPPVAYLLDGFAPGVHGGAGVRADWSLAAALARSYPLVLAGGLDPANVASAVRAVRPLAVDVSSGVETVGVKDPAKIAAFVQAAREAFEEPGRADS